MAVSPPLKLPKQLGRSRPRRDVPGKKLHLQRGLDFLQLGIILQRAHRAKGLDPANAAAGAR